MDYRTKNKLDCILGEESPSGQKLAKLVNLFHEIVNQQDVTIKDLQALMHPDAHVISVRLSPEELKERALKQTQELPR